MTISLTLVAGVRPNFMKIAPIIRAIRERGDEFSYRLVHTGQHYDHDMNQVFFDELGIPAPHVSLGCGGGSHAGQTGSIMTAFETELITHPSDWVIVVGDVNSTLACAIVAKKQHTRVAHVEAGLRSGDRTMPEEINRLVTDSISDLFFVTEPSGQENLLREGHSKKAIQFVGHVMIDNLLYQAERLASIESSKFSTSPIKDRLLGGNNDYGVVTMHRPSNVDSPENLGPIMTVLKEFSAQTPLIFPVHPRTRASLEQLQFDTGPHIHLTGPLGYMEFLNLWKDAAIVLTDSGGLQEETTALGVRCITMRTSTERPVTITHGTNRLAGTEPDGIREAIAQSISRPPSPTRPELWDGKSAQRIVDILATDRI